MTEALVFVDSERPDTYLNSVAYMLRSETVSAVTFVHVYGFPGDANQSAVAGLAKRTLKAVFNSLEALAQRGEYLQSDGTTVSLDEHNGSLSKSEVKAFYQTVEGAPVNYQSMEVAYGELRSFLHKRSRRDSPQIIDVTGCRKRFFGDLVALGLVDGLNDVRTLDLLVKADFEEPWRMLLHELVEQKSKAFEYVDILETRIMMACSRAVVIRAPRLRYASMIALFFAATGIALNLYFGLDSNVSKWVNVLAQFATFIGLVFVFFPPRQSP